MEILIKCSMHTGSDEMDNKNKSIDLNNDTPIPEASYADLYKAGFFDYKKAKLTIVWGEKISINKQIVILRKLYPKLKELSTVDIYKIVQKNKQEWQFAKMGMGNAVDLANEAKLFGLNIIVEELEST